MVHMNAFRMLPQAFMRNCDYTLFLYGCFSRTQNQAYSLKMNGKNAFKCIDWIIFLCLGTIFFISLLCTKTINPIKATYLQHGGKKTYFNDDGVQAERSLLQRMRSGSIKSSWNFSFPRVRPCFFTFFSRWNE